MSLIRALVVYFCLVWIQNSAFASPVLNFVIDIDETIAEHFHYGPHFTKLDDLPDNQVVFLEDQTPYFLFDGLPEFIQSLSNIPGAKLTFFSAGTQKRNVELVALILKRIYGDRYETEKARFGLLSREDLTVVAPEAHNDESNPTHPEAGHGNGKYAKDLTRVTNDLENTLLIDDNRNFSLEGQEQNLLNVSAVEHTYRGGAGNKKLSEQASHDLVTSRDHLFKALGMILSSVELMQSQGIPLRAAFQQIQAQSQDMGFYMIGLESMKEFNPELSLFTLKSKVRGAFQLVQPW